MKLGLLCSIVCPDSGRLLINRLLVCRLFIDRLLRLWILILRRLLRRRIIGPYSSLLLVCRLLIGGLLVNRLPRLLIRRCLILDVRLIIGPRLIWADAFDLLIFLDLHRLFNRMDQSGSTIKTEPCTIWIFCSTLSTEGHFSTLTLIARAYITIRSWER